jgi:hypothetical protein
MHDLFSPKFASLYDDLARTIASAIAAAQTSASILQTNTSRCVHAG